MKLPFKIPLNLAVKPAMRLVGKFLQSMDKNITGADDKIGRILEQAGKGDNLNADIEKFAEKEGLDMDTDPELTEPAQS